jgi:hypothetical protein
MMIGAMRFLPLFAVLGVTGTSLAADPVQWRTQDGGNGHWYQFVRTPSEVCWTSAKNLAESAHGHLAVITSAAENTFVTNYVATQPHTNTESGPYIGATCEGRPWGSWYWVTGEPFTYTAWNGGEPNSGGNEQYVHFWNWSVTLRWNDTVHCSPQLSSYIVEYEADCNNDGIVDYGQIRRGELPDYNGNKIPDCCETGATCSVGNYPVQWRAADGGNGHWYQVVSYPVGRTHAQAAALAATAGARLVSIGQQSESQFLETLTVPFGPWAAFTLGGFQDVHAPDYSEPSGGWRWDDGTPWTFTNWDCGVCATQYGQGWWCQPDNYVNQQYLVGVICMSRLVWDDGVEQNAEVHAIYEWSSDCNNDGIVDFGQILDGTLVDANHNGVPDVCECPGDIDHDGFVGAADLVAILTAWGGSSPAAADLNADGIINGTDMSLLLAHWGMCTN